MIVMPSPIIHYNMNIVPGSQSGKNQFGLIPWLHCENDCPLHDHIFLEIAMVQSGRGQHYCRQGKEPIRTGDIIIVRPGTWHQYLECNHMWVYNYCIGLGYLNAHLSWLRADPRLNYLLWTGPMAPGNRGIVRLRLRPELLAVCVRQWDELTEGMRPDSSWSWIRKATRLADALAELMLDVEKTIPSDWTNKDPVPAAVRNGVETLEQNLNWEWTLAKLAAQVHLHPQHLARLFRIHLGLPPMAYLNRCRMEQAASLLLQTDLSVGDISAKIGWLDQNYFTRRFHAHFGVTPSSYRARFHAEKKRPHAGVSSANLNLMS